MQRRRCHQKQTGKLFPLSLNTYVVTVEEAAPFASDLQGSSRPSSLGSPINGSICVGASHLLLNANY